MNDEPPKISVLGKEIEFKHDQISIDRLSFLKENPRIQAVLAKIKDFSDLHPDKQQEEIYARLLEQPSVKKLIKSIAHHGGLMEPILVRKDTDAVVEGNSRLAAYRWLRDQSEESAWDNIKCHVVSTLKPMEQFALLDQLHLQGKTDWSPYASALYYHSFVYIQGYTVRELAENGSDSEDTIKKKVEIIDLMRANEDDQESNFSYYEQLIRSTKLKPLMTESAHEALRQFVLSEIKNPNKEFKAQELRDRLPKVMQKTKICNRLIRGDYSWEQAFDLTKTSRVKEKVDDIHKKLMNIENQEIIQLNYAEIRSVQTVAAQVSRKVKRLLKLIDNRVEETKSK